MKIAAITDDGTTISQHFGRARHYRVYTIDKGEIVEREMRDKSGHHDFAHQEHHEHEGGDNSHGHGFGPGADQRHSSMIASITDCEAVLVRGMGQGAYLALQAANIKPIVTEIALIEDAVHAYLDGTIIDHPEKLH